MLALLCTLAFALAALIAVAAILATMHGRGAQIASLWAEYRSLRADREFLVQITSHGPAPARTQAIIAAMPAARRHGQRAFRPGEAARPSRHLRAAA